MQESGTNLSLKKLARPQITLAKANIHNAYTSEASYIISNKLGWLMFKAYRLTL